MITIHLIIAAFQLCFGKFQNEWKLGWNIIRNKKGKIANPRWIAHLVQSAELVQYQGHFVCMGSRKSTSTCCSTCSIISLMSAPPWRAPVDVTPCLGDCVGEWLMTLQRSARDTNSCRSAADLMRDDVSVSSCCDVTSALRGDDLTQPNWRVRNYRY